MLSLLFLPVATTPRPAQRSSRPPGAPRIVVNAPHAPNAKLSRHHYELAPVSANTHSADHAEAPPLAAPTPMSWAWLLKRMFKCPQCGGLLTVIAAILDPIGIATILAHLGLPI